MSYYSYKVSRYISIDDSPFDSLIMAAMRKADSDNIELLKDAFPQIWEELSLRYNAPGGFLDDEEMGDEEREDEE